MGAIRPTDPLIVRRSTNINENGSLDKPVLGTFTNEQVSSTFEHYVYPDLNGTIEFEVPYYAQTPISLVGEGTISDVDGPIIRRSKVDIMRSLDPKGMDRPMYAYYTDTVFAQSPISASDDAGGIRNCFGATICMRQLATISALAISLELRAFGASNTFKLQKKFLNRSFLLPLFPQLPSWWSPHSKVGSLSYSSTMNHPRGGCSLTS